MSSIFINERVSIPEAELSFGASRSAGPGGQHVNKVSSRITLRFDLDDSPSLDAGQKEKIRQHLSGRISRRGILSVSSQRHRSQAANKEAATERFASLLQEALRENKKRRPTRKPRSVDRKRLEAKRKTAEKKRSRGKVDHHN